MQQSVKQNLSKTNIAYDSDSLERNLAKRNVEMISPHKKNRLDETKTQDSRPLRWYKKIWAVERFFAWMHNHRRIVVRYEQYLENFIGFVRLAATAIL